VHGLLILGVVWLEGELHVYESNGSSTFDEVTMASRREAPLNYFDDSHVCCCRELRERRELRELRELSELCKAASRPSEFGIG